MRITLTLNELGRSRRGSNVGTGPINRYGVGGMPTGQQALIANRGNRHRDRWRIFRVDNGIDIPWTGDFETANEALTALACEEQGRADLRISS